MVGIDTAQKWGDTIRFLGGRGDDAGSAIRLVAAMAPVTMVVATMAVAIMAAVTVVETAVETVAVAAEMTAAICHTGMTKSRSSPVGVFRGVHLAS